MRKVYQASMMGLLGLFLTGCHCSPWTARYGNVIDDFSDQKLALDRYYEPGLDVSRTGMPDWRRFGFNNRWCPCRCIFCRCDTRSIEYPAFYTVRYYAQKAEQGEQCEPCQLNGTHPEEEELMPIPLPEPALFGEGVRKDTSSVDKPLDAPASID